MQRINDNISVLVIISMVVVLLLSGSFVLIYAINYNKLTRQGQLLRTIETAHQKELLYAAIRSQEKERQRIGRDLHDHVGVALSGLRLVIEQIALSPPVDDTLDVLKKRSRQMIDKIIRDVRNISHALSPAVLHLFGFREGMDELAEMFNEAGGLSVEVLDDTDGQLEKLSSTQALALYRVMEELLNNTVKHAHADIVRIRFTVDGNQLLCDYTDNGIGLPAAQPETLDKGAGLYNIESRLDMIQARFSISSEPGRGFHMHISCPMSTIET